MNSKELASRYASSAKEYLKHLISIDTTNPPGNEIEAARYIKSVFKNAGLESTILESEHGRGNIICRLKGRGTKKPLLLASHLDVVGASENTWRYPPFSGKEAEEFIWGRGAVDMKYMTALSMAILIAMASEKRELNRDIIFVGTADEEAGGHKGASWLVKHHADLIQAEYCLSEVGGFTLSMMGKTFVPVQVAEKGFCWLKVRIRGTSGHGSIPRLDSPFVQLSTILQLLRTGRLPFHMCDVVRRFLEKLAHGLDFPLRYLGQAMSMPVLNDFIIDYLFPDRESAAGFAAFLHNTVSPTMVRGGDKINVIPGEIELYLDGRILPEQTLSTFLDELKAHLGGEHSYEIIDSGEPVVFSSDTLLYKHIEKVISENFSGAITLPMLTTGFTDCRHFSRLGITCYGFTPMVLPPGLKFAGLFHGVNERVPIASIELGLASLLRLVELSDGN